MTTPTPDPLVELARKINADGWTCNGGIHEPGNYDSCVACQGVSNEVARVALPIVRKAQEQAWDDCAHEADRRWLIGAQSAALLHDANPYRGDTDEH